MVPRKRGANLLRRLAAAALFSTCALASSSCVTASMWENLPDRDGGHIDWTEGSTIAAMSLTPVTIALDAALIAGWIWLESEGGDCGCGSGIGFRIR